MNRRYLVSTGLIALALVASGCSSNHKAASTTPPKSPVRGSATSAVAESSVAKSSASAPVLTADWIKRADFAGLAHPELNCTRAARDAVEVHSVRSADVTGDGAPEALVRISCLASTSAWPDVVEIYSDSSGTPALIGTLLNQSDALIVRGLETAGQTVTLTEAGRSKFTALCCPDLNYTQSFTWTGHGFAPGSRRDVLRPCGNSAFQITTTESTSGAGHFGLIIVFHNQLPQACTITGYPGLDAQDATGRLLVHAKRTPSGYLRARGPISTVRVGPGQSASAVAEWSAVTSTGASCPNSAAIAVTPANTEATTSVRVAIGTCELQVHPTVAGSSGRS